VVHRRDLHRSDGPTIFYAGDENLWRYNGTSWTNIGVALHADQHALAWAGPRLIDANDGGIWSSDDGGATWTDHNTNLAITQFYSGSLHPTTSLGLGNSQDNGSAKWPNGDAWTLLVGGDGNDSAISASHPDSAGPVSSAAEDSY
jgi:hypothetical protein